MIEDSTTPSGVTIENALDYLEAIRDVVSQDVMNMDKEDRSLVLGIISAALSQTSESLKQLRSKLEKMGDATPITDEQKLQLRQILMRAGKHPES